VSFEVIMNMKICSLKDLVNFTSASGDRKIDIFAPQVSTHAHANFYPEVKSFTKKEINLVG